MKINKKGYEAIAKRSKLDISIVRKVFKTLNQLRREQEKRESKKCHFIGCKNKNYKIQISMIGMQTIETPLCRKHYYQV